MDKGLYIHVPFCRKKCIYCDFISAPPAAGAEASFLRALKTEIRLTGETEGPFTSVYFGGGTPTLFGAPFLAEVLGAVKDRFPLAPDAEISTECNPGTLREGDAGILRRAGFSRVSVGLQSASDAELRMLGRIHTRADFSAAYGMLREAGFGNINVDVMHALPCQTAESYLETLSFVTSLSPEHISAYSLILEENTPLYRMVQAGELTLPGEDEAADMQDAGIAFLEKAGYARYEISNFARPGYACRHNLTYWDDLPYLGLGPAAHSSYPGTAGQMRWHNTESTRDYCLTLEKGKLPREELTVVSGAEERFEYVMLGLRKTEGIGESAFRKRFGCSLRDAFPGSVRKTEERGLVRNDLPGRFALDRRGLDLNNAVLVDFMEEAGL